MREGSQAGAPDLGLQPPASNMPMVIHCLHPSSGSGSSADGWKPRCDGNSFTLRQFSDDIVGLVGVVVAFVPFTSAEWPNVIYARDVDLADSPVVYNKVAFW